MQNLPIKPILDHEVRVNAATLPQGAVQALSEALSIPNMEKEKAKKMDIWGWRTMPDTVDLWELHQGWFIFPRGFFPIFVTGMRDFGYEVEFDDRREWTPLFKAGKKVSPFVWQAEQLEAIFAWEQGIIKSPAGSGKTVAILAAIQKLGCKSLVIVNTKDILWQWQKRVESFLGENYPFGQIGDDKFEVSPYITIATAQTLNSRFEELERAGFFDEFSFVCLDECHHATADTYWRVVNRFSARYRVGVSATPDKTGDFELAKAVLGPIIHETRPEQVDTLIKPVVKKVITPFSFSFKGHKNRYQRSNWPQLVEALIKHPGRNQLICRCVLAEQGHHQLLVSKRLEHLQILEDMLLNMGFTDPIYRLTGKDDNQTRELAVRMLANYPGLMLSTLADEAMDIPRLDRLHLPFPQRNTGLITQQWGRIEREHPEKADAIGYDYADMLVGPLEKQWSIRRNEVYRPRNYKVEVIR